MKQARHTNRQTLNDSTYEVFGEVKFIERENRMAVARGCLGGEMGSCLPGIEFQV